MNYRMSFVLIFFFFFSCASHKSSPLSKTLPFGKDSLIRTADFYELIPSNKKIVQLVVYERENEERTAQVIFMKGKNLKVTVLSEMGIELLSMELTEKTIRKKFSLPGIDLEFFYQVMADMLAVYGEKTLLLKALSENIMISDKELSRELFEGKIKILSIVYSQAQKWEAEIEYFHHLLNYNLKIKPLRYENLY